jgi:hypothetical protein
MIERAAAAVAASHSGTDASQGLRRAGVDPRRDVQQRLDLLVLGVSLHTSGQVYPRALRVEEASSASAEPRKTRLTGSRRELFVQLDAGIVDAGQVGR